MCQGYANTGEYRRMRFMGVGGKMSRMIDGMHESASGADVLTRAHLPFVDPEVRFTARRSICLFRLHTTVRPSFIPFSELGNRSVRPLSCLKLLEAILIGPCHLCVHSLPSPQLPDFSISSSCLKQSKARLASLSRKLCARSC